MSSTTERVSFLIVAVWFVNNVVNLVRGSPGWIDQSLQWILMLGLLAVLLRERQRDRQASE